MDFVRLGPAYSTKYIPDKLIEGYNSLIWTERFQDFGEFEIKSFDIYGLATLLPEDTLVSHLETQEVMKVETHEINMVGEGEDAQPEITIKGRSATNILEHRWVESHYQKKRRMRMAYTGAAALSVLLVNAVANGSGKDITRGDNDPDTEFAINDYSWTTKDVIPNVVVTETVLVEGESRWWQLEEGLLWPQMKSIMAAQYLGVRCYRPRTPSPSTVVTVASSLGTRGTITRTPSADVKQLRFEVYTGTDRSAVVQFSTLQGHLDNPEYLVSNREYKTVMEIMSGEITLSDVYRPGEAGLTGWRRKTEGFDAGTPEIPEEPEKPKDLKSSATTEEKEQYVEDMDNWIDKHDRWKIKKAAIIADFREEQAKMALRALYQHRKINMFSGDVSSLSPFKYKQHYNLGDVVSLFGDYGKSAKMIVSEYVRTEDVDGDRGFPGLIAP